MKKFVNGAYVEMQPEEIAAIKRAQMKVQMQEKSRPLTDAEVTRILITQQVNSLTVDNNTALRMKEFYPSFDGIVGQTVRKGFKFAYGGKLWQVIQPEYTIQSHYAPGAGTESLYAEVCESHEGTVEDPIPYSGNLALEDGKYYHQDYVIYRCFRDTGNPVYHALADLVGLYVEKV